MQAEADVKQVNSLADRLVTIASEIRKGAKTVRDEIARREREAREAREEAAPSAGRSSERARRRPALAGPRIPLVGPG